MSSDLAAGERRLHPLSFLFTLLAQLPQFIGPLLLAVFFGQRGGRSQGDEYALIGVGFLAIYSLAQYFTYRYRIEDDAVVVRSGVFERSLRHIPFARIQNVSLQQNLLHRLFGVAEVRLESAGATKPEAQMRVLRLRDAHELEAQIQAGSRAAGRRASSEGGAGTAEPEPARELLSLPTSEVLRLGVVSNRGMLIVGAGFASLAQIGDNLIGKMFQSVGTWLYGHANTVHFSWLYAAVGALVVVVLALVGLRLLSMVWALLQFHGFRLSESGGRLTAERGLFTRVRASLPRHRIQAWTMHEGVLHRWFGRRSLQVDSAVVESGRDKRSLRELAPIATPAKIDELVASLLPRVRGVDGTAWPIREWQPLHQKAWRRRLLWPAVIVTLVSLVLAFVRTRWALCGLLLLPPLWWSARNWARCSGWSVHDGLVAFRGGWLGKYWRFAEVRKLQALEWQQSPFDRRWGMATLRFDTAGASGGDHALAIPYLPESVARQIYEDLAKKIGQS
jgi:putative membrane protein